MATSRCPSDGSVGEDLLMEILVRLPFKSLARFQCVSKSWQRLISGNYFRRRLPFIASGVLLHEIHRGDRTYTYACVSDDSNVQDGSASLYPWHETSTMIDGCNGLLLYYAALPTAAFHVVNPTTRRWAALPLPRSRTRLSVVAFDPCSSPHYRVVCFTGWRAQGAAVEVFDSGVGAWREREVRFGLDADAMSATMHYFGGALHVLAYSGHDVRIDLATLECTVTALPAPVTRGARVGHCLGRVRYACGDGRQLKIWELRNEWVLTHAVSVGEVTGEETGSCEVSFLGCHPEREVVYLWVPWKLVVFDLEKRRVEKEWIFGSGKGGARLIKIWLFPFARYLTDCLA